MNILNFTCKNTAGIKGTAGLLLDPSLKKFDKFIQTLVNKKQK